MSIFSPGRATPRLYLFFVAIFMKIVASALAAIGFVLNSALYQVVGAAVWLVFLLLLLFIAIPSADAWLKARLRALRTAAVTIVIIFCVIGVVMLAVATTIGLETIDSGQPEGNLSRLMVSLDAVFGYNDATSLTHQAARNVIDGKNPYVVANIVAAMIEFNGATDKLTPLREGRFAAVFPYPSSAQLEQLWQEAVASPSQVPPELESKFNYPALCFLMPAFFVWLGVGDFRFIYLILLVPVLAYVIFRVPGKFRVFFIIALVASLELWNSLAAGETGLLYFPLLLLAWVLYRRNLLLSALFMAMVVAIKQITWFLLPFYLIVIFRTMGWRKLLAVSAVIAVVFVAANAWFIARDPHLWLISLLAPVRDSLFPLGVGLISLVTGGLLDIRSPLLFTILEFSVLALAIIWYWINCRRYPDTAPVLSILPLFFAWRSLWGYFFYIDIVLLAAILVNEYTPLPAGKPLPAPAPASRSSSLPPGPPGIDQVVPQGHD
jgi:uncharacterized membrane protein